MSKLKFGLILAVYTILTIFIASLGAQVHSQTMPLGLQMPTPTFTGFTGKYLNSEFGIEWTFPEDMFLTEISSVKGPGTTSVTFPIPTDPQPMNPAQIAVLMSDTTKPGFSNATVSSDCKTLTSEQVNLGGKNAEAFVYSCNIEIGATSKTKIYYVDLGGGKNVRIAVITPASVYDSAVAKFEEIIKTIKFTTPITQSIQSSQLTTNLTAPQTGTGDIPQEIGNMTPWNNLTQTDPSLYDPSNYDEHGKRKNFP
jgi:hypothetical protein